MTAARPPVGSRVRPSDGFAEYHTRKLSKIVRTSRPRQDRQNTMGTGHVKALVLSGGAGTRLRPITHLGQAAGARGEQARALLRPGSHRGSGYHRGRHHRGRHRPRDPRGGRRRLRARHRGHLHPAGRAARPRPRGADRPRLPGRRRLRHVPRRQLHRRRDHRSGGRVPRGQARCADPADAGAQPDLLRCRGARRRRPGGVAGGEAEGAQERSGARRRLPLHPGHP